MGWCGLVWAGQQARRKGTHINEPDVLGAIIQLGNCLDLLDLKFTQTLATRTVDLVSELADAGLALPANQKGGTGISTGCAVRATASC